MAQTGFTPIQLYRSATTGAAPVAANLADGELAINTADGKLFYKNNLGAVAALGGGINYTRTTTAVTLVDKQGIIADTTAAAFTVTLPATPPVGTQVWIADGGSWGTNNLTVARNGSTIEGLAENLILDISGVEVQLIYDGTTWQVYAQVGAFGSQSTGTGAFVRASMPTIDSPETTGTIYDNGSVRSNITAVAALDINTALGNYFTKTINANSTFTFSGAPASRAYAFTFELTHTSGAVTWPASVQWPNNNTAPTLTTGKVHLFVFVTDDAGATWRGSFLTNYNV